MHEAASSTYKTRKELKCVPASWPTPKFLGAVSSRAEAELPKQELTQWQGDEEEAGQQLAAPGAACTWRRAAGRPGRGTAPA